MVKNYGNLVFFNGEFCDCILQVERLDISTYTWNLMTTTTSTDRYTLHSISRRIKTEAKAKVVAGVWGTEWIQFLAALDIFHQDDCEERAE